MTTVRYTLLLSIAVLFGCQGAKEEAPRAAAAAADPGHNTLGIWPNVVVVVDSQKTAADLLYEILDEAVKDAGQPALPWPQFMEIVDKVQKCGRNTVNAPPPLPATHSAHAAKIQNALAQAKLHNPAAWTQCATELDHGH